MGSIYILLILVLVLFMTRKTRAKASLLKKDTRYVETYTNILKNKENASEELKEYLDNETDENLKNKTRIVKIYDDLNNDLDLMDVIEKLDVKAILGEPVSMERLTTNSDMFVWLNLALTKAKNKKNYDVIKKVFDKFEAYDEQLQNNVEYNVLKTNYDCLLDNNNDLSFLKDLLDGNYSNYTYDKQLIGVYKSMAASLLAYKNVELSQDNEILLKEFSNSQVGNRFLSNLGIIDKYFEK